MVPFISLQTENEIVNANSKNFPWEGCPGCTARQQSRVAGNAKATVVLPFLETFGSEHLGKGKEIAEAVSQNEVNGSAAVCELKDDATE